MKFLVDVDEFKETGQRQRDMAIEIADKLMARRSLSKEERWYAAALIRVAAETIPLDQLRVKAGQAPQYCHTSALQMYASLRARGILQTEASEQVGDLFGVSGAAIVKLTKSRAEDLKILMKTYS